MTVDVVAFERLVADVSRQFQEGLQKLAAAAAQETQLERKRLSEEALALAQERARLEEARQHLRLEMLRMEVAPLSLPPGGQGDQDLQLKLGTPTFNARELFSNKVSLPCSEQGSARCGVSLSTHVPRDCAVTVQGSVFTVLPVETPDAAQLGHELWNHTVEVPEGWEVVSAAHRDFHNVVAAATRRRWGAMVLGVQNAKGGFDAYYTPLFQAGNHEGKLCQADVDWIEPVAGNPRSFRMTYSGLRLLIRSRATSVPSAAIGGV
jgi:hypothetical protein